MTHSSRDLQYPMIGAKSMLICYQPIMFSIEQTDHKLISDSVCSTKQTNHTLVSHKVCVISNTLNMIDRRNKTLLRCEFDNSQHQVKQVQCVENGI